MNKQDYIEVINNKEYISMHITPFNFAIETKGWNQLVKMIDSKGFNFSSINHLRLTAENYTYKESSGRKYRLDSKLEVENVLLTDRVIDRFDEINDTWLWEEHDTSFWLDKYDLPIFTSFINLVELAVRKPVKNLYLTSYQYNRIKRFVEKNGLTNERVESWLFFNLKDKRTGVVLQVYGVDIHYQILAKIKLNVNKFIYGT